jgi:hypothetical protein
MVAEALKYLAVEIKKQIPQLTQFVGGVIKTNEGKVISEHGIERETFTISDSNGPSIYLRQTQIKTISEPRKISSKTKEYQHKASCRLVFYSFSGIQNLSSDKMESLIMNALKTISFNGYQSEAYNVYLVPNKINSNIEVVFKEETSKEYEGGNFPVMIAVDFDLFYSSANCDQCNFNQEIC